MGRRLSELSVKYRKVVQVSCPRKTGGGWNMLFRREKSSPPCWRFPPSSDETAAPAANTLISLAAAIVYNPDAASSSWSRFLVFVERQQQLVEPLYTGKEGRWLEDQLKRLSVGSWQDGWARWSWNLVCCVRATKRKRPLKTPLQPCPRWPFTLYFQHRQNTVRSWPSLPAPQTHFKDLICYPFIPI